MKKTLIAALIALVGLSTSSCGEEVNKHQKIVFMENAKVFEGFKMKKDYDLKMEQEMKNEATLLDSLGVILSQNAAPDSMTMFKLRKDYYVAQELYNKKFEQLSAQYTTEVNERLNIIIKEYAKEKGYNMILGSGGTGNVMFVEEQDNVTEDLIKYLNNKYEK